MSEIPIMPIEYTAPAFLPNPPEIDEGADCIKAPAHEFEQTDFDEKEFTPQGKQKKSRCKTSVLMAQVSAMLLSVVLVKDSFGEDMLLTDVLGMDGLFAGTAGETWDDAFPDLPNQAVSTQVNESFIYVQDHGAGAYVHSAIEEYETDVSGMVYDDLTNTLTLTDVTAQEVDINLMGNGFTIRLEGENHLDTLAIWGYYYGGSVTFTGDGSLYVNEDMNYDIGMLMECEYSESCIMIDDGVSLYIGGSEAAVLVFATKAPKGIYYLKGTALSGGERGT